MIITLIFWGKGRDVGNIKKRKIIGIGKRKKKEKKIGKIDAFERKRKETYVITKNALCYLKNMLRVTELGKNQRGNYGNALYIKINK